MLPLYRRGWKRHRITAGVAAILSTSSGIPTLVHAGETTTPIEHVVIIIGENRSFDHLFATYVPRQGESVWNLLSKGIITAEGTRDLISAWRNNTRAICRRPRSSR
jgi:phospholipase C